MDALEVGIKSTIKAIVFTNPVTGTETGKKIPQWYLSMGPGEPNSNTVPDDRDLKIAFDRPTKSYKPTYLSEVL